MDIKKRLELALRISENIKDGKIEPNNLYDLQLHISDALEQVKKLIIPDVSKREHQNIYDWGYVQGFDDCHKGLPKRDDLGVYVD